MFCTVNVTFTPTARGQRSGNLTIIYNAPGSPSVVSLLGTGIAPTATLSVSSFDFGNQLQGTTSAPQAITINNTGDIPLTFSSIAVNGNFAQTNTCSSGVGVGTSCTVNVTFTPNSKGTFAGTLTLTDNAIGSPQTVALTGTGIVYPVPEIYQLTPPEAVAGGPALTITATGTGFFPGTVVNWNGNPRATTYVSSTQLTVAILASDIATAGTSVVTAVNPTPGGGPSQFPVGFDVINPNPTLTFNKKDFAVGQGPESIAMGDFNGDGKVDFAVANGTDGTVSVLLGNGDGTFQPQVTYTAGLGPMAVITGDFNHDGKLDLAVANSGCPPTGSDCFGGSVSVFLGNGDGTFGQPIVFNSNFIMNSLASGDFNGDGRLDLAVGVFGESGGEVDIYLAVVYCEHAKKSGMWLISH